MSGIRKVVSPCNFTDFSVFYVKVLDNQLGYESSVAFMQPNVISFISISPLLSVIYTLLIYFRKKNRRVENLSNNTKHCLVTRLELPFAGMNLTQHLPTTHSLVIRPTCKQAPYCLIVNTGRPDCEV